MNAIFLLFGAVALFIMAVSVFVLVADVTMSMKNANGWVYQDRNGTAVEEIYKEEDGCVFWRDVWGKEGKTCGAYSITRY